MDSAQSDCIRSVYATKLDYFWTKSLWRETIAELKHNYRVKIP